MTSDNINAIVPDVTWEDVGGYAQVRKALSFYLKKILNDPDVCEQLGWPEGATILLFGPQGCGKSLIAKAIANECQIKFISFNGNDVLNEIAGQPGKLYNYFKRAETEAPCLLHISEFEVLARNRDEADSVSSAISSAMMVALNEDSRRKNVFIVASTYHPDLIDNATLRSGRFDKLLYVGLPNAVDRISILNALIKKGTNCSDDLMSSLSEIGQNPKCDGFTRAHLALLVKEAKLLALEESLKPGNELVLPVLEKRHLEKAYGRVHLPAVSPEDQVYYEQMKAEYSNPKNVVSMD